MSQFNVFVTSEGPGPGPVLALAGDNYNILDPNTVAAPNGLGIIFIKGEVATGQRFATVEVDTLSIPNTLSIVASTDEVSTNNGVATNFPLAFYALTASQAVVFTANVVGHRDDFSAACGGIVTGVARRAAAGGSMLAGTSSLANEDAPVGVPQFGIQLNGNSINVYAQGLVGQTWNWTCTYQFQVNLI